MQTSTSATFNRTNARSAKRNFNGIITILVMICSLFMGNVYSQVSNYSFAASSGTYTALTSPTNIFSGTWDDNTPVSVPIGFSFTFNGVAYTTVFVNANGYISFGATTSTSNSYVPISATTGYTGAVSAWGHDIQAQPAAPVGSVDYLTSGGVFTVQWSSARRYDAAVVQGERMDFQIRLVQTTNQIQIVYGTWTNAILLGVSGDNATVGGQVGLRGATNTDFKNLNVSSTDNWAAPTAGGSNTASCYYNSVTPAVKPASGQTYTFNPPPPCVAPVDQATGLTFGAPTFSSVSGSFTAAGSAPSGYLVVRYPSAAATTAPTNATVYTAGQALGLGTIVQSGATTTFNATGLAASNTYDFYVYSFSNTLCSNGPTYNTTSPLTNSVSTPSGTLSGIKTVGAGGDYDNLTLAFAAINANGLSGNIELQLITGYPATAETFPIVGPTSAPSGGFTIKVYPTVTGLSVTGNSTTGTLNFNNSVKVSFDGRVNQTGSTKDLTISNSSTTGYAISINTDATNNIFKYCTITSRNTTATSGTIAFGGGSTSGNDNNTIDNCDILDGTTTPANAIYSAGQSTAIDNSGNTISNSNIANFFIAGSASAGILLTGTGNSGWTITNNRFYQGASRTYTSANTHNAISIGVGAGYTITNNTIGFANSAGTGNYNMMGVTTAGTGNFATFPSSYTLGTATTNATLFRAINASFTAGGATSTIQGNTIANIALLTSSSSTTAPGILGAIVVNSGNADIGNTSANTIGATTGQGSLYVATTNSTSGGTLWGIFANSTGTLNIQNNTLGSIDAVGSTATNSGAIVGIDVSSGAANVTLNGNIIGNTTADNIRVGYILNGANLSNSGTGTGVLTSTTGASSIIGLRSTATGNIISLNNITLRGWVTSGTVTNMTGIISSGSMTGITPSITANTNLIGTASLDWVRYAVANSGSLTGLSVANSVATTHSIQNNVIRGITHTVGGSTAHTYINVAGGTSANNVTTISGNTFNNLNVNTTGTTQFLVISYSAAATGIKTVTNNSITTAYNRTGASGAVTLILDNGSSVTGAISNCQNNNFSNITLAGTSTLTGISYTDGGTAATRTITGNTCNTWLVGTGAVNAMNFTYWNGVSSLSNNTVTNISGQGAITGITIGNTVNSATSVTINGNTLNNLASTGTGGNVTGISCNNTSAIVNISGHSIFGLSSTGASATVTGILIGGSTSTRVFKNKIYNLSASGATPLVSGIVVSGGTSAVVYNNYIGDLAAPAGSNGTTDVVRGIGITSTSTSSAINVYFNTIRLAGAGGTNFSSAGLFHTTSSTATTATLNLRNNIIINLGAPSGTGVVSVLHRSSAATLGNYGSTSNKNLLYAGAPSATHAVMYDGTTAFFNFGPAATAGTYQNAVTPRDAVSFNGEAAYDYTLVTGPTQFFQSITPTDPGYLHVLAGLTTAVEGGADPIATPSITDDYDGDTRNATKPDVGADEFVGVSPAPVISNLSTPTGTCAATAHVITADVVPTSGTITSVTLNYNNGAVGSTAMTFVSGNTYTGTIPAASPTNSVVTWSVSATNSVNVSSSLNGTSYSDDPLFTVPLSTSKNPNTSVCAGTPVLLTGSLPAGATLGTQTTTDGTNVPYRTGLGASSRHQFLYLASELTSAGISAGNLTGINFTITSLGTGTLGNYSIKMSNVANTVLTSTFVVPGASTTVYTATTLPAPVSGLNAYAFSTPFTWDGTSNVLVDICYDNTIVGGSSTLAATTPAAISSTGVQGVTGACTATAASTSSTRPLTGFTYNGFAPYTYAWSDGGGVISTQTTATVSPSSTTTYSFTITSIANGCTKASTQTVTTVALPAPPNGNNSIQCGVGVPTCFVTTAGGGGGFKWYNAQTGGILLQNGGGFYTSSISSTTHFWVSESNGTCESLRTEVVATVNTPDPVSATSNGPVCQNSSLQLTATVTSGSNSNNYTFVWTASPASGSGIPTTQAGGTGTFGSPASTNVTPTASGTFTYTVTATDGACTAVGTVAVTVNPQPVITSATATPSTVCAGTNVTLNGTSIPAITGTATLGTASTTYSTQAFPSIPYANWDEGGIGEVLVQASELTALNLLPGNITSLAFDVANVNGAGPHKGFTIKIKQTALTAVTGFDLSGMTTVYGPIDYQPVLGINTHTFTTPFNWNGTSNLLIAICFDNEPTAAGGTNYTNNALNTYTTTAFNSIVYYNSDGVGAVRDMCGSPAGTNIGTSRPNMKFGGQIGTNVTGSLNWSWNPGALAGSTVIVTPSSTTTYTVTATIPATGCSAKATTTVTVNPLPPAPAPSNGSGQCGTGLSDMSVSSNNITDPQVPAFFKWYDAPTGGVLKQSGTSTTYTTQISATTTLYVSEVSLYGCEGPRVMITSEVSDPDPLSATTNPATSVCYGSSFDISSSYTPDFNSFATFSLTATGGAASGVTGTVNLTANATGSNPYTVTPTTSGTYTYTITAFDPDKNCTSVATRVLTVYNYPVITSATATPSTICAGATVTLNGRSIAGGTNTVQVGSGTGSISASTAIGAFYGTWYGNGHAQILITASELSGLGFIAGNLTALKINVSALAADLSDQTLTGFTIKLASVSPSTTSISTFQSPTFTTVWGPSNYTPVVGLNTHTFASAYNWDGTSNIIVDYCFSNGITGNSSAVNTFTATAANSFVNYNADGAVGDACANTSVINTSTNRPNIQFIGLVGVNNTANYNWVWNPGNINAGTTGTTTVTPMTTTVYTVTATTPGSSCSVNSSPVTVTVNPIPAAPSTNTPVSRCGPGSVTLTASGAGGVFHWYTVPTGGVSVFTGASYITTVAVGTTTFYVDETSEGGCVSARSALVVTASTPPTLSITAGSATTFCQGSGVTLNGATGSDPSYVNFAWTANPSTGAGLSSASGNPITVTPTASGTFTITLTANDNGTSGCANIATKVITVNPKPVIASVTATPPTICNGGNSTLSAFAVGPNTLPGVYCVPDASGGGGSNPITSVSFNTLSNTGITQASPYYDIYPATGSTTTSVTSGQTYTLTVDASASILSVWFDWDRSGTFEDGEWTQVWTSANTGSISITVPANAVPGATAMRLRSRGSSNPNGASDDCSQFFSGTGQDYTINVIGAADPAFNYVWNPGAQAGASVIVAPTITTSYTLTATNPVTGCFSTSAPLTVTVTPVTATASASPSTPVCAGTAVTLTALPTGGAPFTYDWHDGTGSVGTDVSISVSPATTTTYTVTVGDACGNTTTATVTVNVNPLPTANITETGPISLCSPASQTLHATTNAGAPTYQWTLNGVNISGATAPTYTINTVSSGAYRVIITNSATGCVSAASAPVTVTINQSPTGVTASASTNVTCNGTPVNLFSSADSPSPTILTQNWEGNLNGWTLINNSSTTGTGNVALDAWTIQTNPYTSANSTPVTFNSNSGSKFILSNADISGSGTSVNTKIVSPVFSLSGYTAASMSFNHYYRHLTLAATVDITTDGGANWTTLQSYSADQGTSTAFSAVSIDLAAYLNQPSVQIRFNYVDGWAWYWAIDDISITGTPPSYTYSWASSPAGFTSTQQNPTGVTPSVSTIYTATVTRSNGCSVAAAPVTVTVNPRPTAVLSGSGTYCQGTNTSTNLTVNFTGTAPWNYTYTVDGASPVSGTTSSNPLTITVSPSNATGHVFTYAISALSDAKCTSVAADLTGSGTVTVNPLAANPTATVVQPTCALGTGTINVTAPLGAGNTYSLDGINFQSNPSFPGQAPGTYTVYVHNSFGCFSPATTNVTVNPQPFVPGAPVITGIVNVCPFVGVSGPAGQLTYTATATGNGTQTFAWVVPPTNVTIVSGQGTATLVLSFQNGFATQPNKQIRLTVTNQCGPSPMTIYYLAAQIPNTPAPIVGPTDACPLLNGPAVTYTIPKAPGAKEYFWSVPQVGAGTTVTHPNGTGNVNDTVITVAYSTAFTGGTITVYSSNDCGVSGVRSITVTRNGPSQPNVISGPTNACPYITPNTPATYTVPAVPGVTYAWVGSNGAIMNSPQGSNTMSVTYPIGYTSGTISVTASTGCGTSIARTLTITTLNPATPGVPDVIQTHFCGEPGGRKYTYTLSAMPSNATSVLWTVPAGATFLNLSPVSIEVTYPNAAVNGVVTVQAANPCASSVIRSVNVKLPACPVGFAGNNNGTNGTAESKGAVKAAKATAAPVLVETMEVKIFPNPTVSDFKLEVLTSGTEEITVRVLDNQGRLYKNFKVMPYQTIALGAELKAGSYLIEVRQGKTVKTTKVIKF